MTAARAPGPGLVHRGLSALRSVGPLAVAGGAANGANVIVTVVIARLLTARQYGGVAQLVGVFVVLSMPGSALLVGVVRRVTAQEAAGRHAELRVWLDRLRRRTAGGLGILTVLAVGLRGPIGHVLGLPGPTGVVEVVVAGGGWALLSVERGLLQSRRAYGRLARNLAVEGAARSVTTLALVGAGAGIEGTAVGLLAAMAVCVVDARASLRATRRPATGPEELEELARAPVPAPESLPPADPTNAVPRLGWDLAVAVAALGLIATLQYGDVVVIGRRNPMASGSYAAISVACTALVFAAIVLSGYLLPEAVWRWHHGRRAFGPLAMAVAILAVPSGILAVVAFGAPVTFLRLVFGPKLTGGASGFGTLSLGMTALAVSVLLTNYLLGIGRRSVVAVLVVAAGAITVALITGSPTPGHVAAVELTGQALLCLVLAAMVATGRPVAPSAP